MQVRGVESLTEAAIELANRWVEASESGQSASERRTAGRLASLVSDPDGLELAMGFVDKVARPEDLKVAARELSRLDAGGASAFLSVIDRGLMAAGKLVAPLAPPVVVPAARVRLRQLVGHLVVDAKDPALGKRLAAAREEGYRLNINLLGEAVLGEAEAEGRTRRTRELLERDDVDYVSIKVSSLVSQISTWDEPGTVARVLERLRPLYAAAAAKTPQAFVNLDMEEYRDLGLTLEVFEHMLNEFPQLQAGIVLQAYLPDSYNAMARLIDYAQRRHAAGGAPIKVRLVKGANLAMERVDADIHDWAQTPYGTKAEVDANYVRLLDMALRPEVSDGLRLGVASHNTYHLALAHLLATDRGVTHALDVEMLQGMAPAQVRAVAADTGGPLILYTPVVAPEDFDVAVSYLVRRLEENATEENFLHALFAGEREGGFEAMVDQEQRFRDSVAGHASVASEPARRFEPEPIGDAFANTPDSDPSLPQTRQWATELMAAPPRELTSPELSTIAEVDDVVARAGRLAPAWAKTPAAQRSAVLRDAARELQARRGALLTQAAHEGGKTVAEGDPEVSEAIDFARYYAARADELPVLQESEGLSFTPDGVVLITPPWNFPVAIPIGGVLAALAAGSAVIIKPAPPTPGCVEIAVEAVRVALQTHGFDPDLVQVIRAPENEVGQHLVAHDDVDTVILTGAYETSAMFTKWRAAHPGGPGMLGETSGKNSLIITPSADYDLAVADAVKSAFGHAGQKCSAASVLILVGSAGTSDRLRRQLVDAVQSLRVGWPSDLGAVMGPVIEPPTGKLLRALTELEPGQNWLVAPQQLDETGRLWSPGLKDGVLPGSEFHLTEYFGPVLGIMHAKDLEQAMEWQNATDYGLTAGLHSLDPQEIGTWQAQVQAGNAYINRGITGAIVQRQSFGGWKRSSVGPGAKAGGPNYVAQLGTWRQVTQVDAQGDIGPAVTAKLQASQSSGANLEWLQRAAASDASARDSYYRLPTDLSGLRSESNVFRYRPISHLWIRAGAHATTAQLERIVLAATCARVQTSISVHPKADIVAGALDWVTEDDAAFAGRIGSGEVAGRVRVVGGTAEDHGAPVEYWEAAANSESDVTLLTAPVVTSGVRELLTVLAEQAVSRTMHRFGHITKD